MTDTIHTQPEPAGELSTDYIDTEHTGINRELLQAFYEACWSEGGTVDEVTLRGIRAAIAADRAMRQPEPEGPTDEELLSLDQLRDAWNAQADAANSWDELGIDEIIWWAQRQAFARWGRPTPPPEPGEVQELVSSLRSQRANYLEKLQRLSPPQPVPVSERPWEREGWCHPQERWAWFYNRRVGWRDAIPPESLKPPTLFPYTHSLPFNALPLPSPEEVEG